MLITRARTSTTTVSSRLVGRRGSGPTVTSLCGRPTGGPTGPRHA